MSPVKKADHVDVAAKTLKTPERVSKSPSNISVDLDTALIRRKRKLYSPKDESEHERVILVTEMDEDKDFKTSKVHTPKYKATSYKDIEMDRQKRLRQPRNRKSTAKTIDSPSPRTKKMNDIFNNLKSKVECPDTLTVIDKNTQNDLAVYNFTSDSEDEDFKQKKIEVQKRISSTTVASGDSILTRLGRSINRVNYSETKSSDETNKKSAPKKKRTVRRKKTQPKSRLVKPVNDIIDEKMRKNAPEELNTSLVLDKPPERIPEEPKLILPVKPQMEPIPDDTVVEVKETNEKPKKTTRKNKRTEALSLKKEKNLKLNTLVIEKDNDDRTISPLPGLNVETIQEPNNDANDSVSAKMLQKFKEIYQDGPEAYINETNTTQNLLSDVEHINYSPTMNITDEFNKAGNYSKLSDVSNEIVEVSEKPLKKKTNAKNAVIDLSENYDGKADSATILRVKKEKAVEKKKAKKETQQVINLTKISDAKSEVSIETVGKSPITAHGDSDEQPPNAELLTEKIKPRDLDVEYQNQSVRDYLDKLREVVNESPANKERKDSTDSVSTRVLNTDKRSKFKSPVVSVSRLSLEDISRWLPSRRNSDTDSSYSKATSKQDTKQKQKYNKHVMEKESSSDNDESPVQKIDKISLEFNSSNDSRPNTKKTKSTHSENKKKIDEEVPSHNESEESIKPNEKHSKKHKQEKYINLEEPKKVYTKRLRSRRDCNKNDTTSNDTVSPVLEARNVTPKKIKTKLSQENRKSLISPIKLFSDFKARNDTSVATSIKKLGSIISNLEKELKDDLKPNYLYKSKREEMSSPGSSSSKIEDKEISSSTVIEVEKTRKRKSKSPVISNVKRRKAEDTVVSISESGPSVSSVNEWFRRNAPVSKAESVSASIQENIENVMEKLDTTLVEIHQNTSKKFIHMFVEAQKHLNEVKQERRKLYKTVASDILARVVKVMDEKFTELDKRSQDMDAEFMENLKVQAAALIRDDCRKKQAMVSLLREDLNATLARIDKKKYRKTL
ncbi:uncharacterized protein LOC135082931 [Ostrinia nubilalis]|uniref:uncharacterized protein LOC135082931 n=1 Tax=Ostrinia nubilalis TaxID=29057 RepID=UPI003082287B